VLDFTSPMHHDDVDAKGLASMRITSESMCTALLARAVAAGDGVGSTPTTLPDVITSPSAAPP